jgi:signal transduction histidine kinase
MESKKTLFDTDVYYSKESVEKNIYLDSLQNLSVIFNNDSVNRKFLFDLSTQYYYLNNIHKSLEVNRQVLNLSVNARDSSAIAKSYHYIGDCYEMNNKDSAYYYYQKAEKFYRLLKNDELIGKMLFNKAYLLFFEGNYLESEIMVSNSLQLLKNSKEKQLIFSCYNLIGTNFEKLEEYEESLKYYLLAKELLNVLIENKNYLDQKNNYKIALAVNIANIYEKQFQYSKAEKELESVLTEEFKVKWPKDYTTVIGNLGYVKTKLGQLKEGEALMKEALVLSRKIGVESSIVYKLHNLGKYYVDTKDTLQAIRYLKESLQLAEKLKSTDDVKINLQLLSTIDKANTSYYDKRYITVSDSLTKVQRKNRNKYARIEYETAVVEDANKELSSKNLYLIFGVVVLVAALGVRYVVGQRKEIAYRKQLQAAELELFDLMRSSQIALNSAREEEQNRISRDLHDNVMNKLYGTRLQLGMLNSPSIPDVEVKRLEQIDVLQTIEQDIRAISHDLHTDVVASHFDYPVLLAQCVQQLSATTQTNLHLDCAAGIDWEAVSGLVKITLYRMVQEALSNVVKYAAATDCHITISQPDASTLLLTVRDTGKGFDVATTSSGIGLKNMRDRARFVKADFRIESVIGQGTSIECKFVI